MARHTEAKTGNEAMAEAMRQINPDVVAAYPITPATEIVQIFSQFVADGKVKTEFVAVESEHSAMSAVIGASAAGARAMTATSSQGLALMNEMLYIASGLRLPIVMPEVNRALSSPINIHCDHSDTMNVRDSGWLQIYSENSQEAYDNIIQAVRIAEHKDVRLPVMVTTDGFIISHCLEMLEILDDAEVQSFIGEFTAQRSLLDFKRPYTAGAIDLQDFYFEHKRQEADAMGKTYDVILQIAREFADKFGRQYGFFESVAMEDADIAIVVMGSAAGTAKVVVDGLRRQGIKAGLLKIRVFRPFPVQELKKALSPLKAIAVLDRADPVNGQGGAALFNEIRSALYDAERRPSVSSVIYGLGGRDITAHHIESIYKKISDAVQSGRNKPFTEYVGVRE